MHGGSRPREDEQVVIAPGCAERLRVLLETGRGGDADDPPSRAPRTEYGGVRQPRTRTREQITTGTGDERAEIPAALWCCIIEIAPDGSDEAEPRQPRG